jgi:hypothetical protein
MRRRFLLDGARPPGGEGYPREGCLGGILRVGGEEAPPCPS